MIVNKVVISRNVQFIERCTKYIKLEEEIHEKEYRNKDDQLEDVNEDDVPEETNARPVKQIKLPKKYDNVVYVNYTRASSLRSSDRQRYKANIPESYKEAIESFESVKWKIAMNEELSSL